jgi:precorrin-2 dehydrogenase/sirohydrochlorin ferrochelatase
MENRDMSTLALNIRMKGRLAVVIGGGAVALRKLRTLLTAGAAVKIVAMEICPEIKAISDSGTINVTQESYTPDQLDGAFLVIAATNDTQVNARVNADACERGMLVSVVDDPAAGDVTFPAVLHRGNLEIAVSTGGQCPTFAVDIRDHLAGHIGSEYGIVLEQLASEREKLLTNGSPSTYNTQVLRSLSSHLLNRLAEPKEPLP